MISGETKSKVKIESGSNQKSGRSAGRENCAGTEPDKQKRMNRRESRQPKRRNGGDCVWIRRCRAPTAKIFRDRALRRKGKYRRFSTARSAEGRIQETTKVRGTEKRNIQVKIDGGASFQAPPSLSKNMQAAENRARQGGKPANEGAYFPYVTEICRCGQHSK